MVDTVLEDVRDHLAESSHHIDQAKEVLRDTCDEVLGQSRRLLRGESHAREDFAEDARHIVKIHLVPSMAGTVVVGLALGFVVGWWLASGE